MTKLENERDASSGHEVIDLDIGWLFQMRVFVKVLPALAAGIGLSSAAAAATPLQATATANPAATASGVLSANVIGGNATNTTAGSVSAGNVGVAQFDTVNGILVGATVNVNTAVSATATVFGTVNPSGGGRTVASRTTLTGSVSAPGLSFGTAAPLVAARSCSGGNCANSPNNQSATTAGTISGSSAVSLANLASYAGTGSVNFIRSATGSTTVTNGSGATSGTANGQFTFGSATPASNVYSITYDFLNFANPSFSGSTIVTDTILDFGTLFQNSGPVTLNLNLFNVGNINTAGLSLTSIDRATNNAGFTSSFTTFTNGLDAGNSRSYSVTFDPALLGLSNDTFTLTLMDFAAGIGGRSYRLTAYTSARVIENVIEVPEPAVWGLMIIGFGMVGVAQRRHVRRLAA